MSITSQINYITSCRNCKFHIESWIITKNRGIFVQVFKWVPKEEFDATQFSSIIKILWTEHIIIPQPKNNRFYIMI